MDPEKEKKDLRKKELDSKIADDEAKITLLDQLEVEFESIKKSVNRCVDLLSFAVQSDNTNIMYEDLNDLNNKLYKDSKLLFEDDVNNIKTEISRYNAEKKELLNEDKK